MTPEERIALIDRLKFFDTPTVCNAVEVAQGKRGFKGFTRRTMHWSGSSTDRIVGFARTAKIASASGPLEGKDILRSRRMEYFRSMAFGPRPGIAVIEDVDGDAAIGAWWGELHAKIHGAVFKLEGAICNGLMRDLGDLPETFPILAGSLGPSHGFVHVREIGTPVTIFGMLVHEGDLIHADIHGSVNIPAEVLPDLSNALDHLIKVEGLLLEPLKKGSLDFDQFEQLWAKFEKVRT